MKRESVVFMEDIVLTDSHIRIRGRWDIADDNGYGEFSISIKNRGDSWADSERLISMHHWRAATNYMENCLSLLKYRFQGNLYLQLADKIVVVCKED